MRILRNLLMPIFLLFATVGLSACDRVEPGQVGIKVYMLGGSKGVDHEVLPVGRHWIGVNERLYLFPTFTQNTTWANNEQIVFQDIDGLTIAGDFGIQYQLDQAKIATIFQKYRRGIDEITDTFLRNEVRDALVAETASMKAEDIYGRGKEVLMQRVLARVQSRVGPDGILVASIYAIGPFRLPPEVMTALNAKIAATQKAQQRENEVAQAKAEADKEVETARGRAQSVLLEAKAQAEANQTLARSLTPELVQWQAIQKWNGTLPTVTGTGGVPLVNLK